MFMEHYDEKIPEDTIVFSDNGGCFINNGADIIDDQLCRRVKYPACVHQYISPNDNKLHGLAKSKWRKSGTDFSNDVGSTLLLLKMLDDVPLDTVKGWFQKNFFIGNPRPTQAEVKKMITGSQTVLDDYHSECQALYRRNVLKIEPDVPADVASMQSDLDGVYWNIEQQDQ